MIVEGETGKEMVLPSNNISDYMQGYMDGIKDARPDVDYQSYSANLYLTNVAREKESIRGLTQEEINAECEQALSHWEQRANNCIGIPSLKRILEIVNGEKLR